MLLADHSRQHAVNRALKGSSRGRPDRGFFVFPFSTASESDGSGRLTSEMPTCVAHRCQQARDGCEETGVGSRQRAGVCTYDGARRQQKKNANIADGAARECWFFRSAGKRAGHPQRIGLHETLTWHEREQDSGRRCLLNLRHTTCLAGAMLTVATLALLPFGAHACFPGSDRDPCVIARPGHLAMAKGPEPQVVVHLFVSYCCYYLFY